MDEYKKITEYEALKLVLSGEHVEFKYGGQWRKLTRDYNIGMLECELRVKTNTKEQTV